MGLSAASLAARRLCLLDAMTSPSPVSLLLSSSELSTIVSLVLYMGDMIPPLLLDVPLVTPLCLVQVASSSNPSFAPTAAASYLSRLACRFSSSLR